MDKLAFKNSLVNLLEKDIDNMTFEGKMEFIHKIILKFEIENDRNRNASNKGKPWRDEEIQIILLDSPTSENCLKYAKIFKRGYGSIEQIYRWSNTPFSKMSEERRNDSFMKQIKRVAKAIGHRG